MAMKIEGKHYIISGGAAGLGLGAAKALLAKGGRVTILDRDDELGPKVAAELGDKAHFVQCDLTEEQSIVKALDSLKWKDLHGLVNCAGTGLAMQVVDRKGKVHDISAYEWLVRLNLIGNFSLASKCAGIMAKGEAIDGEKGCIVNVASVAAFDGQNGQSAYTGTKAAMAAQSLPMARDLAKHNIRVNCIAPGIFSTALTEGFEAPDSKVGNSLRSQQVFPNTRFGTPAEFGHLVVFLNENGFMNGETIRIDAAIRMPKL